MTGNEEYGQYSVDHNVDSYEGFGVPENQYAVEQLSFSHSNMYANQMVPDPIDSAGCYDQPQLSTPTVVPRSYFRDGTSQEASFSTEDIEFRPAGSMKRFQTAAKAARRSRSPISGKSPKMEKPTFVYSEKEEQNRKLRDLERRLPTGCDRNVKAGWFSVRQYSIDFLERIAQPTKTEGDEGGETMGSSPFLYFSFRSPNARKDFYENWNSQLLRRIQDKFNFKLNHMMWLKTLITGIAVVFS